MAMDWQCIGSIKRSLIYKLIVLENYRNALNEELHHFTEKTAEDVEEFLSSTCSTHSLDGINLLKTLDSKCHVIKELMALFEDLKSDLHCLKTHLKHSDRLSSHHVLQFSYLKKSHPGVFVPHVLKFGSLLQNVILASSITKAVQIVAATFSLQQITLSLKTEKEESPEKISPSYGTEVELFSQNESKRSEMGNSSNNVQQNVIAAETQRNVADTFLPKEIFSNMTAHMTTHLLDQQFGNDLEVQHQKQTSSQLMDFLRTNGKTQLVPELRLTCAVNHACAASSAVMQQQSRKTEAGMADKKTSPSAQMKRVVSEMDVSGPIFKIKNRSVGSVTYSCMIATPSELWDVGDISTEVGISAPGLVSDERSALANHNESHVSDVFSLSVCPSNSRSVASEREEHQHGTEKLMDRSVDGDETIVRIPEFQIKKFEEMPVVVTHLISPSNFYIQHKDTNLQELSQIMARRKRHETYADRNCIPDIGTYIMGWVPKQKIWCRGQVAKICGISRGNNHSCNRVEGIKNIEVEVRRIDYGDSACLPLCNMKEFCTEVAKIPVQALQVSMANVNPVNGESWSTEAVNWFKDKVNSRTLYARLYPEETKVMVELFMEKGKIGVMRRGASLSLRLAQNGLAKHNKMHMTLKMSHAQARSRKQEMEWEKYLISCCSQNRMKTSECPVFD